MNYYAKDKHAKQAYIRDAVARCYWQEDVNCATTMLRTLADIYGVTLQPQLAAAAAGLHGAGGYGAQCGLIEGSLLFLGILAQENNAETSAAALSCRRFAADFEKQFGSLLCRQLRPGGFRDDDPPHLCEELTCRALTFSAEFIGNVRQEWEGARWRK